MRTQTDLTLAGHPFAPIGMGEHIRCSFRALRSVAVKPKLLDIYGLNEPEPESLLELQPALTRKTGDINIFHVNGDEIQQMRGHLATGSMDRGYNIVYPAWELSRYPDEWASKLDLFDEIWAPSLFIQQAISKACKRPVLHMPLACEPILTSFLGRRYFKIPESSFAFLFFFDFRSYATRKNPGAVIECFQRLLEQRPHADVSLVIKLNGAEQAPNEVASLMASIKHGNVIFIDRTLTDNEVKNLVRCCDCFLSLHRSEGFGRGLSEAMFLGKPVIGTGYSGNMDFMTHENSLPVSYKVVPVAENEYPFWENQEWADPDIDEAVHHMARLIDDPSAAIAIGRRASSHLRENFSYRKTGLRYLNRIAQIGKNIELNTVNYEEGIDDVANVMAGPV